MDSVSLQKVSSRTGKAMEAGKNQQEAKKESNLKSKGIYHEKFSSHYSYLMVNKEE